MKKNRMMRLASILLVCVLLTTSVISGTFAKYASTATGSDEARVAYWGFGLDSEIAIDDLFVDVYADPLVTDYTVDSVGADGDDVIAPGTANFKTFKFAYTNNTAENATAPEVGYNFTVSTEGSVIAPDIESNTNIQWAVLPVNGTATLPAEDSSEWGTWDKMIDEIKLLSGDTDGVMNYAPNTAPAAFAQGTEYIVAWQWIFETAGDSDTDADGIKDQDEIDTAMGNKSALDEVVVKITITAEQVD